MIQTNPSGAKLYLDGQPAGKTPYTHSDSKIIGSITTVRFEKEGYEPLNTSFARNETADVGAIIGGVFFLFPFLWTMKYNPNHIYELIPSGPEMYKSETMESPSNRSKAVRLRELKGLLDDEVLTQQEYDKEKKRILEEDE